MIETYTKKSDVRVIVAVCVDLSKGRHLIAETTGYLAKVRDLSRGNQRTAVSQEEIGCHEDAEFMTAMPVNVVIAACKWDLFEKLDQESKKWVSRSLRYLAHTHSASILTCSNKNNTLGLNLRSAFV